MELFETFSFKYLRLCMIILKKVLNRKSLLLNHYKGIKIPKQLYDLLPTHFKLRSMSVRSNRYGTFERFHSQRSHAMSERLSQHGLIAKFYLWTILKTFGRCISNLWTFNIAFQAWVHIGWAKPLWTNLKILISHISSHVE